MPEQVLGLGLVVGDKPVFSMIHVCMSVILYVYRNLAKRAHGKCTVQTGWGPIITQLGSV